jgi:hypothetical protein
MFCPSRIYGWYDVSHAYEYRVVFMVKENSEPNKLYFDGDRLSKKIRKFYLSRSLSLDSLERAF